MERAIVVVLALVGAGFVGLAGFQAAAWLAPSIHGVEAAADAEDGSATEPAPLREQDETHEIHGER